MSFAAIRLLVVGSFVCAPLAILVPSFARSADVVECGVLAPTAAGRSCAVTPGTDGQTLLQGDVLGDGTIYRGGAVLVDVGGEIACVGCGCSAPDATVVRCPEAVVSPGLINAYDHITFSHNPPAPDTGERYEQRHDWRVGARGHDPISVAGSATADQIVWAELRQVMSGTTSATTSGGRPGLLRNLDSTTNQGLGLPAPRRDTFPLGDSSGTQLDSGCAYPNIRTSASIAADPAYLPIVGEGIDTVARNEFLCTTGQLSGGQDLVEAKTAIGKGLAYRTGDLDLLASEGAGIIWSPRSNLRLYGDTARVSTASALGVEIALGTDWIVTGSMNMLRELACADDWNTNRLDGHFSSEALWQMATKNAASLTAMGSEIGTLAPGLVADIAVFDATTHADYDAILHAQSSDVVLVLRGGTLLFGEQETVDELTNGACAPVSICGNDHAICLDSGQTLSQLAGGNVGSYPLAFCGVPVDEPACHPMRPESVDGSTIYSGIPTPTDVDGDGILDVFDNCPSVFNPVRPVDFGSQTDFDLDGIGDECDPTPVPEPGAAATLAIGALLLLVFRAERRPV